MKGDVVHKRKARLTTQADEYLRVVLVVTDGAAIANQTTFRDRERDDVAVRIFTPTRPPRSAA